MIQRIIRRMYDSPLLRHVAILTSGSVLAQCIPLLLMVVYARMFSAETFAILGLLQICIPMLIPLATAYFEWAIPSPRSHQQARLLASMALAVSIVLSIFVLIVIMLAGDGILAVLNAQAMKPWALAYAPIILFASLLSITSYWLIRMEKSVALSRCRLVLALASAAVSLALGYAGNDQGLLIGYVFGMGVAAAYAVVTARVYGFGLTPLHGRRVCSTAQRYRDYPIYGSFPSFMLGLAGQIPLILITKHYTLADAGHFAVARNILFSGVALISLCIGQVVLKHITNLKIARRPVWPEILRITSWLAAAAATLSISIYLIGPLFFRIYLGAEWQHSASMTRSLSIACFFWLIAPVLSFAVIAQQKIRWVALWQVSYGLATFPCLILLTPYSLMEFIEGYSIYETVAYAAYAALCLIILYRCDCPEAAKT